MVRKWMQPAWAALALAAGLALPAGAEEAAEPLALRHAVTCPPFKGEPLLAARYRAEMVRMLKAAEGIEYFEEGRGLGRRVPEFSYEVNGAIETNAEGKYFVAVTLFDRQREEQIGSLIAPASTDPSALGGWRQRIESDFARRATKMPFECRVRRQAGQDSVSLDRGLGSGLQPGMVLLVSLDEEPLISPVTGELVGRDSPRAAGKIQVFRVMEDTAYARPVLDTKLPRFTKLFARTF